MFMCAKSPGEAPRLRALEEIDMDLVSQAQAFRANDEPVPTHPRVIGVEYVRYLRAIGTFTDVNRNQSNRRFFNNDPAAGPTPESEPEAGPEANVA